MNFFFLKKNHHNDASAEFEEMLCSSSGTQQPQPIDNLVFICFVNGGIKGRGIKNVERLNKSKKTLYLSLKIILPLIFDKNNYLITYLTN